MRQYPPRPAAQNHKLLEHFRSVFQARIAALSRGSAVVKIPSLENLYERRSDMAYHFKPELFIQSGGATDFEFPQSNLRLNSDEICIIPRGVPHGETTVSNNTPFENIVVCFYSSTTTVHLARQDEEGRPYATDILFYRTPLFQNLVSLIDLSVTLYQTNLSHASTGVKGLLIALFSILIDLISADEEASTPESQRVYQCQWEIRNHLNNSDLSVQWLADKLDCTANYLSKVFHKEIGEKITTYIARVRLENALAALNDTTLSVKEISNACGFRDPNYFSRVFKQKYDVPPKDYRRKLIEQSRQKEEQPKVVLGDYEEYHFGYDKDNNLIKGV